MGTEDAIVRYTFLSGTHAIAAAFFGAAQPGDEVLIITGPPYDTLDEVTGARGPHNIGSLADFDIACRYVPLTAQGAPDDAAIVQAMTQGRPRVCHIQRSCGYALRPTLTVEDIGDLIALVRSVDPTVAVTVDNCYGEFTECREPGHVGADLVMGSMIKNPGGTIATGGGYVAGTSALVAAAAARLVAAGMPAVPPATPGLHAAHMLQGLWSAPARVGEALKGGRLVARVLPAVGYAVLPVDSAAVRPSFITAVECGSEAAMVSFCEHVQRASLVGAYIRPVPGETPGYNNKVIFADGTFVDGSTSELSADGPIRPPFTVYCQGGTHWVQWAAVLERVIDSVVTAADAAGGAQQVSTRAAAITAHAARHEALE